MNIELQLDSVFIAGAWAQFGHGRLFLCGGYLLCKSHVCKRTVIGPLVHTNSKFEGPEADCHLRCWFLSLFIVASAESLSKFKAPGIGAVALKLLGAVPRERHHGWCCSPVTRMEGDVGSWLRGLLWKDVTKLLDNSKDKAR
ncbi:uncharacterized protein [Physcomitrium patens]|uniref:uncharacterized protein n=1 Tax=Physcomitrium patens TaxID=3218 RepID=UPI003CCC9E86